MCPLAWLKVIIWQLTAEFLTKLYSGWRPRNWRKVLWITELRLPLCDAMLRQVSHVLRHSTWPSWVVVELRASRQSLRQQRNRSMSIFSKTVSPSTHNSSRKKSLEGCRWRTMVRWRWCMNDVRNLHISCWSRELWSLMSMVISAKNFLWVEQLLYPI